MVMLLTLPYQLGGYKLKTPMLNGRATPTRAAKSSSSKTFYACDLYWPDANVAAEYDSDAYHTGPKRIASDSKRRNSLASMGINTITVTNHQLRSTVEFEKIAKQLAKHLGKRLQFKNPGFIKARNGLRNLLLQTPGKTLHPFLQVESSDLAD